MAAFGIPMGKSSQERMANLNWENSRLPRGFLNKLDPRHHDAVPDLTLKGGQSKRTASATLGGGKPLNDLDSSLDGENRATHATVHANHADMQRFGALTIHAAVCEINMRGSSVTPPRA